MKTKKLLLWSLVLIMALPLNATTYYVRSAGGLDSNDGLSPETPLLLFVTAINKAVNGDVINISGTFNDFNRTINKSITIQGTDKNTAIFDGTAGNATTKPFSTFGTAGTTITIENITFQNYNAAAFQCFTANTLNVKNVIFKNNTRTGSGGAIDISTCNLSLEDCYFYNNSATASSGAVNISSGANNSIISINRCLFENNRSVNGGSAIAHAASAVSGTASATFTITNSTFTGNQITSNATGSNMGVINLNPTNTGVDVKLINNTIAYNSIGSTGAGFTGGLYIRGSNNLVTLINNILFSNFDTQTVPVSKSINSTSILRESRNNITDVDLATYNWTSKTTNGATMASDNISAVINGSGVGELGLAVSLADNGGVTKTLALSSNSVAINAGYATGTPAVDQRNITRSGSIDVGSYEYVTANSVELSTSLNSITGLDYSLNDGAGPSAEYTFTVSGSYLADNVVVTPPTNFEISLTTGTGFQETAISISNSGVLAPTTIFVRLKAGLSVSNYSGNIEVSSTGGTTQTVELSGNVTGTSTSLSNIESAVKIIPTATGFSAIFDNDANIEIYASNGKLIEKTKAKGTYSRSMDNGMYIILINGKATKFVK